MIVHVMGSDIFIAPYIQFINTHFESTNHLFYVFDDGRFGSLQYSNVRKIHLPPEKILKKMLFKFKYVFVLWNIYQSEKVILHGIFNRFLIRLLAICPVILYKCYWCIWGGDLYVYQNLKNSRISPNLEKARKRVICNLGGLITHVKGDVELARKWYNAKGQWYECFMYLSNLAPNIKNLKKNENLTKFPIKVLIGNSADQENHHLELFNLIPENSSDDLEIILPLSYGNREYAKTVISVGEERFKHLHFLLELMPLDEYQTILKETMIAIFGHKRQQAMGNIITLIGMGKKVYLRSDITSWDLFKSKGIKIFDILKGIDFSPISDEDAKKNIDLIATEFSITNLKFQWSEIFNAKVKK